MKDQLRTQENTDNELIAEFDDQMIWYTPKNPAYAPYWKKKLTFDQSIGIHVSVENFKYHTSWDWLMPVVEKIESLGFMNHLSLAIGSEKSENGSYFLDKNLNSIAYELHADKKTALYNSVVEFIKFYNNGKDKV